MSSGVQYLRVNGEMLKSMKGSNVCLLGKLLKVDIRLKTATRIETNRILSSF